MSDSRLHILSSAASFYCCPDLTPITGSSLTPQKLYVQYCKTVGTIDSVVYGYESSVLASDITLCW